MASQRMQDAMLVVIGSGPGIGSAVATLFAERGFQKVALISRNADRLAQDCHTVEEAAQKAGKTVSVGTFAVDITDTKAYKSVLDKVSEFGNLECVFFNAARVIPSPLLEHTIEELEYDFKITNSALYATAQWAVPKLLKLAKDNSEASPSLFVTNSLLYKEPLPALFALCLTKTAQRNMVQCFQMEYEKQGIHVGLVTVGGEVSPKNKVLSPKNIAEKTWGLFSQSKKDWTWDVELVEES